MREPGFIRADWPVPANVHAFTSSRRGGFSTGNYASLNLADHVGDDPQHVAMNREQMRDALGLPEEPRWLTQAHGDTVVCADEIAAPVEADAAWTDSPNVVCAVLTADCLPVLFCTKDGSHIAAAHAGWRGLCAGILEQTVDHFLAVAIDPAEILVWLGPAIGPDAYEVDSTVHEKLLSRSPACESSFVPTRPRHWNLDLYCAAQALLEPLGVMDFSGGEFCSFSQQRFYSHRRLAPTGRQASLIWRSA
jgi:YfiH family protein